MSRILSIVLGASFIAGQTLAGPPQTPTPQTPTASVQPSTLLQQSLAALVGNTTLSDVTLTGTARRIAGSDDETGSATFQAMSGGYSRLQLNFASGIRSETRTIIDAVRAGSWSGPDGVSHRIPFHNLLATDGTSPALIVTNVLASSYVVSLTGVEQKNEQSAYHLVAVLQFPNLPDPSLPQHLSRIDLFLDPSTLLPVALDFSIHPDDNELLDIPVELAFSDYRTVTGVKVPFHIQKSINHTLALDLQFDNALINSGLSASAFSVQ
jgi:hypothetical protein